MSKIFFNFLLLFFILNCIQFSYSAINDDGYGQQQVGYGQQQVGYGQQQVGYGQQKYGYGQQQVGYGQQQVGYGQQQVGPIKKGLYALREKKKNLGVWFFGGLADKFGNIAKKYRHIKEPHEFVSIPVKEFFGQQPVPYNPGYDKNKIPLPMPIEKPIIGKPDILNPIHMKPDILKPIEKPIIDKPIIDKPDKEIKEEIEEEPHLDARRLENKPKRPKRQVHKGQLAHLSDPKISTLMDKIVKINTGYKKALSILNHKLTTVGDDKKKEDIKHLIGHIEEASKRFDLIIKYVKEKILEPKNIPEVTDYIQKVYDVEIQRINSITSNEEGDYLSKHDHKDDKFPHFNTRKDKNEREHEDKMKIIPILVHPKIGSDKSPRFNDKTNTNDDREP